MARMGRMFTSEQFLEMARECLDEADREDDDARKKALVGTAKLYSRAAMDTAPGAGAASLPSTQKGCAA